MALLLHQLLIVGLGGAFGAMARFLVTKFFVAVWPAYLGAGTLAVNVAGSFAIGVIMGWATHRNWLSDDWRIFLVPGILGGLTTFSALAFETALVSRTGTAWLGGAHLLANVILGLLAVTAGDAASRMIG